MNTEPIDPLSENRRLQARLVEAEDTLHAIRTGAVDALIVDGEAGPQIYLLQDLDAESNRFRSDILSKVNDAVVAIDEEEHVTYLNDAAERQYGVTASQALGNPLHELYGTRWFQPDEETTARTSLRKTGQCRCRNIHVKRTGEVIQVESSVSRLRDGSGRPAGMLSVIRDITLQQDAENSLKESELNFRTLFDSIDQGFCVIEMIYDETGKPVDWLYLQVSPSFEKQTGLGHCVGKTVRTLIPDHEQFWFDIYSNVARSGEPIRFQNTSGHLARTFDLYATPFGAAGKNQVAILFTDITAQCALEDALRASEQRANSIIQSITDGFLTLDAEWRISYLSPRGAEILSPLQKTATSVIGRIFWEEFPETSGTVIEDQFRRSMEAMTPVEFETFYEPLQRWFELRGYPSAQAFSLFFLDISGRKETESALRSSQEVLARQADALRAADRSKDEFLAMLAHELRNPLAPLRNASEILAVADPGSEERLHAQSVIDRQIGNMSRMIDDLLDVSRINEGKIELRRHPVTLEDILTAAASLARAGCAANDQELEVRFPATPVYLEADATRLEQVFGNLLGNAIKYSGKGSRISLTAELPSETAPFWITVRVRDNGVGIDPELLPRIFGLFVQASRTLDRSHGGLGIGLTLVDRLVRLHGGTVTAHSGGPGRGTEFVVNLPVLRHAPVVPPIPQPVRPPTEKSRRVLIVDDNTDSARTLARLLTIRGHHARTAFSGPDAVEAAAEFHPEMVLLDIGLPGMDGFEVARRLRLMATMKNSLIIAMSGYGRDDDRHQAKLAGFDEYLVKPVNFTTVRDLIAREPAPRI